MYSKGCEPSNPNRPKTQVIKMLTREMVIERLATLRADLEQTCNPTEDKAVTWWLLLDDVLDYLAFDDPAERLQVMGGNVTAIVEATLAKRVMEAA
jgi:hypothetical protein